MRFLEAKLAAAFIATMWVSAAVGNGCSADNTPQGGSPVASVNQPPGVLNPSTSDFDSSDVLDTYLSNYIVY